MNRCTTKNSFYIKIKNENKKIYTKAKD